MVFRLIVAVLVLVPGIALADASNGEFMGYQLGKKYPRTTNTRQQVTTTGNLLITAEKPEKPDSIEVVKLLTTEDTLTIGYIDASAWFATEAEARALGRQYVELLQAKYPDWTFVREVMDAQLRIREGNVDNPPHNLRLRLTKDNRDGKPMWRFSMTLGWMPDNAQEQAWKNQAIREQGSGEKYNRQKVLEGADTRGL
ncbi:MAG: hypothetical protein ACR2P6_03900 [Gammaproteobacteria bacterium]